MKAILGSTVLICMIWVSIVLARSPASPLCHVVTNFGSNYFFVMNNSNPTMEGVASGACYKIMDDLSLRKIWTVKGFYSFPDSLRLSPDGHWLARVKPIYHGKVDNSTTLVEIYRDGVLQRTLAIGKFVDDVKKLELDPWSDNGEVAALNYAKQPPFDLVSGASMGHVLETDGMRKFGDSSQFGNEFGRIFIRLDSISGIRFFVNIEDGTTTYKYNLNARANVSAQ